jgi:hypothetical protein
MSFRVPPLDLARVRGIAERDHSLAVDDTHWSFSSACACHWSCITPTGASPALVHDAGAVPHTLELPQYLYTILELYHTPHCYASTCAHCWSCITPTGAFQHLCTMLEVYHTYYSCTTSTGALPVIVHATEVVREPVYHSYWSSSGMHRHWYSCSGVHWPWYSCSAMHKHWLSSSGVHRCWYNSVWCGTAPASCTGTGKAPVLRYSSSGVHRCR